MRVQTEKLAMKYNDAGRDVVIFQDLSVEIPSGQSVAIVGKSGIGKTTFLNIVGGIDNPVSGRVILNETCITDPAFSNQQLSAFRGKHIGFVFQFHHLFPESDAVENAAMPLRIQGVSRQEADKRAVDLLERLGLGHRLTHRPGALSGGEQQRVAIARALVSKPGLILADEPTGNLDHVTGAEIMKLLVEMQKAEKITMIVVTHSLELAGMMERILEMTPTGMEQRADVKVRG